MNWKKIPAALTAVCLAVSCLCMTAFANDDYRNRPLIPPSHNTPAAKARGNPVLPKFFLDKTAHWRYNTTIFRMNVPGETAHAAPKGKAKSLRQKDRFGTKLWKAYSRTGEAIRPWRRIFRVNGQRHQTLAMAHEDFCPVRFLFCPRSPEQIEEGFVMVQGSVVASSPLLYALIAAGLAMVVVFAVISAVRACRRCAELGIGQEVIQGVIKGTVASAIVPSVAILLGFLTLSVSLGAAWPWWRLSVIGSLSYEVMATQYTANGLGVVLNEIMTSPANVFGAVMMVMTIGIMIEPLAVVLLGKKYSTGIMKAKTGSNEWGQIMSGCFFLAMFAVYLPIMIFSDLPTTLTLVVSLGVTLLCGVLSRKATWLGNFTMAIAMIVAMASSVVWVQLFG